jgi:hypothetical protein
MAMKVHVSAHANAYTIFAQSPQSDVGISVCLVNYHRINCEIEFKSVAPNGLVNISAKFCFECTLAICSGTDHHPRHHD